MEKLASVTRGAGPLVLFIHGGMNTGDIAWWAQAELGDRYRLRTFDRAGYGASASLSAGEDIELDSRLIASELTEAAHLVGHSSGAIVTMNVAAQVPTLVKTLTLIEPPAWRHLDDPRLVEIAAATDALLEDRQASDRDWLKRFVVLIGGTPSDGVLDILEPHVGTLRRFVRPPTDLGLPIASLRAADIPVLVVSGGNHEGFELLCDHIAQQLDGRRVVIPGAGHAVQMTGTPFNETLERFLTEPRDR